MKNKSFFILLILLVYVVEANCQYFEVRNYVADYKYLDQDGKYFCIKSMDDGALALAFFENNLTDNKDGCYYKYNDTTAILLFNEKIKESHIPFILLDTVIKESCIFMLNREKVIYFVLNKKKGTIYIACTYWGTCSECLKENDLFNCNYYKANKELNYSEKIETLTTAIDFVNANCCDTTAWVRKPQQSIIIK